MGLPRLPDHMVSLDVTLLMHVYCLNYCSARYRKISTAGGVKAVNLLSRAVFGHCPFLAII